MNSRVFMNVQAGVLGLTGIVLLFAPEVIAGDMPSGVPDYYWSQIAAAGTLAFAVQNWAGRNAIYGGIYGKPIVLANLVFGLITALALLKMVLAGETGTGILVLLVIYAQYGAGYTALLVRGPKSPESPGS